MKLKTLAALAVGILGANTALAIPTLQLDIDGGTYIGGSEESTVTDSSSFDLWALATTDIDTALDYYLSIALTPKTENIGDAANLGMVTVGGTQLSSLGSSQYGTPPVADIDKDLASHGIFETYYYELTFNFPETPTIGAYNVQDDSSAPGNLYKQVFQIDASALASGYGLHFDLYTYGLTNGDKTKITEFAPFSHDAAYCIDLKCEPVKVSEPSTLALFGVGLMSLVAIRRRLRRA
jgi:hypothetical protein